MNIAIGIQSIISLTFVLVKKLFVFLLLESTVLVYFTSFFLGRFLTVRVRILYLHTKT